MVRGKGWHGEPGRHSIAAKIGRMNPQRRREILETLNEHYFENEQLQRQEEVWRQKLRGLENIPIDTTIPEWKIARRHERAQRRLESIHKQRIRLAKEISELELELGG